MIDVPVLIVGGGPVGLYESTAIVPDGTAPPAYANPVTDYTPSARPGGRAPHAWLERDGTRVSTIDLVGKRFVLFGSGRGWRPAATALPSAPPLDLFTIGPGGDLGDPDGHWHAAYDVDAGGAVLVRPDGYVGWRRRAPVADPTGTRRAAVAALLGRG
jgi:hypothetical protein